MKITIEVTASCIRHGKRRSPHWCPVALAINPHLRRECYASVEKAFIMFSKKGELFFGGSLALSGTVRTFMERFDLGCEVQPISFELDVPRGALLE